MTFINWDVTTRFDPNSRQPSTHGIPVPSYGNYGGPNYSAGVEGGTTPEGPNPTPAPVDPLDTLFWQHDLVYQHVQDGLVPPQDIPNVIAQADVTLVEGMYALTKTTNLDPEALLYDAFGTLSVVGKILTTPTELAYLEAHPVHAAIVITAAQAAIPNFELGLTETPGEARSLNGAFHVFEAHFADLLPLDLFALASAQTTTALNHPPNEAIAQPMTLPPQSHAVDHLPDHLPAIPSEVTIPDAAAGHIAAADHIAQHIPDWFALASAQTARAVDHPPNEIPPPPPVAVTLPPDAQEPLTHLPGTDHIPDWFVL
jgi:hypothetical protein